MGQQNIKLYRSSFPTNSDCWLETLSGLYYVLLHCVFVFFLASTQLGSRCLNQDFLSDCPKLQHQKGVELRGLWMLLDHLTTSSFEAY